MSTLLVQVLESSLEQNIRFSSQDRYQVAGFIPYIYMHNAPAGTFTFELEVDSVVVASKEFDCDDIKTALDTTDNYAHVFYPIIFDNPVQLKAGDYIARITSSGYTSGGNFLGWIQQHENLNNVLDYTPVDDTQNPLALRVKVYRG